MLYEVITRIVYLSIIKSQLIIKKFLFTCKLLIPIKNFVTQRNLEFIKECIAAKNFLCGYIFNWKWNLWYPEAAIKNKIGNRRWYRIWSGLFFCIDVVSGSLTLCALYNDNIVQYGWKFLLRCFTSYNFV